MAVGRMPGTFVPPQIGGKVTFPSGLLPGQPPPPTGTSTGGGGLSPTTSPVQPISAVPPASTGPVVGGGNHFTGGSNPTPILGPTSSPVGMLPGGGKLFPGGRLNPISPVIDPIDLHPPGMPPNMPVVNPVGSQPGGGLKGTLNPGGLIPTAKPFVPIARKDLPVSMLNNASPAPVKAPSAVSKPVGKVMSQRPTLANRALAQTAPSQGKIQPIVKPVSTKPSDRPFASKPAERVPRVPKTPAVVSKPVRKRRTVTPRNPITGMK